MVPMVMSACEVSSQADEAVVASLSFQFGKVCSGLAGETLHQCSTETKPECRLIKFAFHLAPRGIWV